jgi:hypothetical protein
MKGKTTIELRDAATGKIRERVTKSNLVTNAAAQLLAPPTLPFVWGGTSAPTNNPYAAMTNFLPIAGNSIGGALLLNAAMPDGDADINTFPIPRSLLTGHAGMSANAGADPKRGALNTAESRPLDGDGYRFVFEFGTDKANGTTACIALTSPYFGSRPHGVHDGDWASAWNVQTDADVNSGGFLPNSAKWLNLTANAYYYGTQFNLGAELAEGTFSVLAYEPLPDGAVRLYVARYAAALQIVSYRTPSMQNMSPVLGEWAPPPLVLENVLWSTASVANIHAYFFHFSPDDQCFHCVRCADSSNLAEKTFEHKVVTLLGAETNTAFTVNDSAINCYVGAMTAATPLRGGVRSSASVNTMGISKCGFLLDGVLYLMQESAAQGVFGAYDANDGYAKIYGYVLDKQKAYSSYYPVVSYLRRVNWQTRQVFVPFAWYFQSTAVVSTVYNFMPGYLLDGAGMVKTKFGFGRVLGHLFDGVNTENMLTYDPALPAVGGVETTPIKYGAYCTGSTIGLYVSINPAYLATINNLAAPITKTSAETLKITYELTVQ